MRQGNLRYAAKRAAKGVMDAGLFFFIKEPLEEILKPWTPEGVRAAIQQGMSPFKDLDVSEYQEQIQPYASLVRHLEVATVVEWIHAVRPDLVKATAQEPDGKAWLEEQFAILYQKFFA